MITEDERRKEIVDRIVPDYVAEKFEGFYYSGRTVMFTPSDYPVLVKRIMDEIDATSIQIINHRAPKPEPCDADCRRA